MKMFFILTQVKTCDEVEQGMLKCDIRRELTKCDTNFGHYNSFKVANKNPWDFYLISKLIYWNSKILQSENDYLQ